MGNKHWVGKGWQQLNSFHSSPDFPLGFRGKKTKTQSVWAMLWSHLHNSLWWLDIRPPSLLTFVAEDYKGTICSAVQTTRRRLSKEGSEAFKSGHFDCVTDWFQVRQLWEAQPEENCPPWSAGREGARLHGWDGIPEFLNYSRLEGIWRAEGRASEILLWWSSTY